MYTKLNSEKAVDRNVSIDYLRSLVTVSVVAHHAALAYTTFSRFDPHHYKEASAPIVDVVRFFPLNLMVGWNDLYFMALMFLVSGLFVAPSITRKGASIFLRDRVKRLGIPFILATVILSPLTFYASWLLSDRSGGLGFLGDFISEGTWNPGPLWFLSVLLTFCIVVAAAFHFLPGPMATLKWTPRASRDLVVMFVAAAITTTLPTAFMGWPPAFILLGPLGMAHPARVLLYFVYFLLGIAIGAGVMQNSLSRDNLKYWPIWLILGAVTYLINGMAGDLFPGLSPLSRTLVDAVTMSFCCALTILALLGAARSLFRTNGKLFDSLSDNAYGIYIVHYCFVIWTQYILLPVPYPAFLKFLISFLAGLAGAWVITALLRKTSLGKVL
jgi:glucans biosynthesis protein C